MANRLMPLWTFLLAVTWANQSGTAAEFVTVPGFDEQVRWTRSPSGVRVFVNRPLELKSLRRQLVIYATPNGNTIEQTLGCRGKGLDFRFDVQHVAAQVRRWREAAPETDLVLCVVQAPKRSWPAFRADNPLAAQVIRELVESLTAEFRADAVVLSGHSGGGSFVLGYVAAVETIPAPIERIVLLDANYSYTDVQHGDRLLNWLRGDSTRRLIVIAYDDREIVLNGKKVIGPDGGTYRASQRMVNRLRREFELAERDAGPFRLTSTPGGQFELFVHPNPDNKILHTALVGDMNGLLHGLSRGAPQGENWGSLGGPRAYGRWIQPEPFVEPVVPRAILVAAGDDVRLKVPERPVDAATGSQFQQQIASLSRQEREAAVLRAITAGNVPETSRRLVGMRVEFQDSTGASHVGVYYVTPDYLAVGSNQDSFRMPMTPQSAVAFADAVGAAMITTKVSDDIFSAARIRVDPRPLTKDRDAAATFYQHHQIIESQLREKPRAELVAGIKKDVVLSNRLATKPHKVAIYGWHESDGTPIQPLYVGHVDWYVDYSHGVRLMADRVGVDGRQMTVAEVLKHPTLHPLLSDEGPIDVAEIRRAAGW